MSNQATNTDARHSNFNHTSGDQYTVDADANTVVVIENVTIVIENVAERTSPRERRRERRLENVIYETIVCGTIVICCTAVVYALRVVLRLYI